MERPLALLGNVIKTPIDASDHRTFPVASAWPKTYALQSGYEPLIRAAGTVTGRDIERLHTRLLLAADARDLLAARDSLKLLLDLSQLDTRPAARPVEQPCRNSLATAPGRGILSQGRITL